MQLNQNQSFKLSHCFISNQLWSTCQKCVTVLVRSECTKYEWTSPSSMEKGTCGCVCVWVKQERQMEERQKSEEKRNGNSTIHLAEVLVVLLYPTGAENTQILCVHVCVVCVYTCKENDNRTGRCGHSHAVWWGFPTWACVWIIDTCIVCMCLPFTTGCDTECVYYVCELTCIFSEATQT